MHLLYYDPRRMIMSSVDRALIIKNNSNISDGFMKIPVFLLILSIFTFPDVSYLGYFTRILLLISYFIYGLCSSFAVSKIYFVWACLFSVLMSVNTCFAYNSSVAISTFITTLQAVWTGFIICSWLRLSGDFNMVFRSIITGGLLLCVRLFRYIDFSSYGSRKVSNMLGVNVNALGYRLAISFAIAFFFMLMLRDNKKKYWYFFCSFILAAFVFITGSRRALILIFIAISCIMLLLAKNYLQTLKAFFMIIVITIALYFAMTCIPALYSVIGVRMERFVRALFSAESVLDGDRDIMILRSIELFFERPFLGWGMGNFKYVSGLNHEYSHNTYVELLYATGVFGFICYYSMLYLNMGGIRRLPLRSGIRAISVCLLLYIIFSDFAAVNYTTAVEHIVLAIIFSLITYNDVYLEMKTEEC